MDVGGRAGNLTLCALLGALACDSPTRPQPLAGTWTMVSENGMPLPSDPVAPAGCCITLSGTLELEGGGYALEMTFRNKVNGTVFSNVETGTYAVAGDELSFEMREFSLAPFLLGRGTVSGDTITLQYGDEGPGSNQRRAAFERS